ncbi:CopG family antitoxin [Asticcacaulis sp. EMRT-3]|uniref:CopG family antitoxin n=1 Tax=Asticcacaulis sp. EMRT-3 TaxID=3040349 RepID=UPI0024AFD2EE|nr:CopG family antitoxin [Asticcacaulis sp. EMRT-3]MDI7776251.1 CopG family antitoxin [Asticcacaulis sp. EMRT-3]
MSGKDPETLKPFPSFASDQAVEDFIDTADLSDYDFSDMRPMNFERRPKDERLTIRLPSHLLALLKSEAARRHMPYGRFIRQTLEKAVKS